MKNIRCIMDGLYFLNYIAEGDRGVYDQCVYDQILLLPSTISFFRNLYKKDLLSKIEIENILYLIECSEKIIVPPISNEIWQKAVELDIKTTFDNKLIIAYSFQRKIPCLALNKEIKENI